MSNKLKQQLRLKMLGQLSDEKTWLDIDNAYGVCKDFSVSFLSFLARNYKPSNKVGLWESVDVPTYHTAEELFNIFIESYDTI